VTVPLAEELAFRGYLLHCFGERNGDQLRFGHFTWAGFLVSSMLFGLLHQRWLAGILAGIAYALVLYRHGRLSHAVLAHGTTNLLIAAWVLVTGHWQLWG
jgi:CAAX prenyl protease-like protein